MTIAYIPITFASSNLRIGVREKVKSPDAEIHYNERKSNEAWSQSHLRIQDRIGNRASTFSTYLLNQQSSSI